MKSAARLAAAIEILEHVQTRNRPVAEALKDWGHAHRFAGSSDRSAIGTIVYDCMRHRSSLAFRMNSQKARALVIGLVAFEWKKSLDEVAALFDGSRFAPKPLESFEQAALETDKIDKAPDYVKAEVPRWLWPQFVSAFKEQALAQGRRLAERAPIDLRVNTLKCTRERALESLTHLKAEATPFSPAGLRIGAQERGDKSPNIKAEESWCKGWVEVQDEASQMAALLSGCKPEDRGLDYCAGAGGKTLALAALMRNKGQIFAHDTDRNRLAAIYQRLERAGVQNAEVVRSSKALEALKGEMDYVFVDAPCSGTGVWRRKPDSRWRLREIALERRIKEQADILRDAKHYVRPGGALIYVTCSVLLCENQEQVEAFLREAPDFELTSLPTPASKDQKTVTFTPHTTQTDGFFIACLKRAS